MNITSLVYRGLSCLGRGLTGGVLCLIAFTLLMAGCMETAQVAVEQQRSLAVSARAVDQGTGAQAPLNGVNIKLYDFNGSTGTLGAQVAEATTDASGNATLNFQAPIVGKNFALTGEFNGQVQRIAPILLCNDTNLAFRFAAVPLELVCGSQNAADSLVFFDETGSRRLIQNTPVGIAVVEACWSLHNGPNNAAATVTIPAVAAPYKLTGVFVNGAPQNVAPGPVTVQPGSTLTLCFQVPTTAVGTFTQDLKLTTNCGGAQSGAVTLHLRADVVPPECRCQKDPMPAVELTSKDPVRVDSSVEISAKLFTNTFSCPVTLENPGITGSGSADWTILSPAFPVTLQMGESVEIRALFRPRTAGESKATAQLRLVLQGGDPCTLPVEFTGNGCASSCPTLTATSASTINGKLVDTLSERSDNRVLVSAGPINSSGASTADRTYRVSLSDSACSSVTLSLSTIATDSVAARFFKVSPTTITLNPGESATFTVTFTAPQSNEFARIVQARKALHPATPPEVADSAFVLQLSLNGGGCTTPMLIPAVVTPCPGISKIINLRAYAQQTPQKPQPENEVFNFGTLDTKVLKSGNGSPGLYPPTEGDIFVDVNNNNAAAVPPQAPILKLRSASIVGMGRWKSNFPEASFDNACSIVLQFCPDKGLPNYSRNDITTITPGDVIAFDFGGDVYGLLFVRAVFNGTEANTNKQSAIEYRVIYPVICVP